ncbi:enoyl-CoA hydratase/isomerase family protein [Marinivivus vitaminiproducens]|uniref:enoyl-CoA hydratase/isomerase family protein n=1 Tax=Marinivivus vitaminiproducens TaxID=3035935 RepID=UPI00279AFA16|nr:enoyl-CoA hydratase [Geminicoccaceae bacterium SCSIO 64248]
MHDEPIRCSIEDGVATVTLNNPPLNLVTLELTATLDRLLDQLAADRNVRVMVLTGHGDRAFCAGSDIKEFPELTEPGVVLERKLNQENVTYSKVDDFPKPTIAAVRGLAFGGGLELAVCCDLIVVEDDARLCLPEIKLGVFPGSGGTVRVTRRIGEGRAKEMMFLGEPIDAQTALAWGLVNRVVPKGTALEAATGLARRLADQPNIALQLCKRAVDLSFDGTEDAAIEGALALSGEAFATEDCKEGVRAFFAKETPRFTHS